MSQINSILEGRRKELEEHLRRQYRLLFESEKKLDLAESPKEIERLRQDVETIKTSIARYEDSLSNLDARSSDHPSLNYLSSIQEAISLLQEGAVSRERSISQHLRINELPFETVDNFTGRKKELDELVEQLQNGKVCHVRSYIFGMGGVGKTSLAIEAVHRIKITDCFPDGIIWYRVRDEDLGKVIDKISHIILRALRHENSIAGLPLDEKIEAFKREFQKYKILFVLDNADYDLDKVLRPLLALFEPFSVLVTSRQELPLPSTSHIITLGGFTPEEAKELFIKIIGEKELTTYGTEEEVEEICRMLGHLPLAVKLAAFYIKQNRRSLREYLLLWRENREKLRLLSAETLDIEISRRNVSACFDLSINGLSEEEYELFLWMGLFQSNFDLKALLSTLKDSFFDNLNSNVTEGREGLVRNCLNKLVSLSLVDKLEGVGDSMRIYLHPLLMEFAVERRGGDVLEDRKIIYEHYLKTLQSDVSIAQRDYIHVKNAINWKFNLAEHQEFIKYVSSIRQQLFDQGIWRLLDELLQFSVNAAQFLDDKARIAKNLTHLGDLKIRRGDQVGYSMLKDAMSIYENGIELSEDGASNYLFLKYLMVQDANDLMESLARICEGVALYNHLLRGNVVHFIDSLAGIYNHIGDFSNARNLHQVSSGFWKKEEDLYNWRMHEHAVVDCITGLDEYLNNLEFISTESTKLASEHRNIPLLVKNALPDRIRSLIYNGEFQIATVLLEEMKKYVEMMDSETDLALCYSLESLLYERQGDYIKASYYIERANTITPKRLRTAYLSFLSGDLEKMIYSLEQIKRKWEFINVYSRMVFYGLSFILFVRQKKTDLAYQNAVTFIAYRNELDYKRIIIDYPEIEYLIQSIVVDKQAIEEMKFTLFNIEEVEQLNYPQCQLSFQVEPEPKLLLPKIVSIFPMKVSEILDLCTRYNLEIPIYFLENADQDTSKPARFVSAQLAQRLCELSGFVLPEDNDFDLVRKSVDSSAMQMDYCRLILPTDEDWNKAIKILLRWCDLDSGSSLLIESVIWTVSISVEDRYRLIKFLREFGPTRFPRALYYKLRGTCLSREFASVHESYLKNQWRALKSLFVLMGIEEVPPISGFWGVETLHYKSKLEKAFIVSALDREIEVVHPSIGFADCVVFSAKLVNDYLCKDTGEFHAEFKTNY
jgi:hypothetical protein